MPYVLASYEDVPCQLCTSLLFMKICLANNAHPCVSRIMHILAFYEDVSRQSCTSSLLMHILTYYAHSLYRVSLWLRCDNIQIWWYTVKLLRYISLVQKIADTTYSYCLKDVMSLRQYKLNASSMQQTHKKHVSVDIVPGFINWLLSVAIE